ncbi:MAG: hypothetical protein H9535_15555 [Ignavibacteria bacterium]|nr:hypothetical protein [Ignavibacteria bacterium]
MRFSVLFIVLLLSSMNQLYCQAPAKQFTLDEVMQTAARLFYPIGMDSAKGIKTSICANDKCFIDTENYVDTELKEFCFETIETQLLNKQTNEEAKRVFAEYNALCKSVQKMNWSSNQQTRLQRIQGAIWYAWGQNQTYRAVILKSYQAQQSKLSFVIIKSE